eukprot:9216650-Ditylum_brightwellii.AAC.1
MAALLMRSLMGPSSLMALQSEESPRKFTVVILGCFDKLSVLFARLVFMSFMCAFHCKRRGLFLLLGMSSKHEWSMPEKARVSCFSDYGVLQF